MQLKWPLHLLVQLLSIQSLLFWHDSLFEIVKIAAYFNYTFQSSSCCLCGEIFDFFYFPALQYSNFCQFVSWHCTKISINFQKFEWIELNKRKIKREKKVLSFLMFSLNANLTDQKKKRREKEIEIEMEKMYLQNT